MRRYLDFDGLGLRDQTASAMRAARYALCLDLFSQQPPMNGVLNTWSADALEPLLALNWYDIPAAPTALQRRNLARRAVRSSLESDVDCLAPGEHALLERILALEGTAELTCADDFDAALALRNRLWCDIGGLDGRPAVRLDPMLEEPIRKAMDRFDHLQIRLKTFTFDAMIHAMLYAAGFMDDELPRERFCVDVLGTSPDNPEADRLARNFVEAAYDCVLYGNCRLLLHEALALPESLVESLAMRGADVPPMTPAQMLGCMNELLPEERGAVHTLKHTLQYALRPDIPVDEAAEDLKLLTKQGVGFEQLQQVTREMLCVMPTPAIEFALRSLVDHTPTWL
ncbi:hypothetical protein FACS1894184_02610 [Clostridia bacterium]|nr:hypothetical protein FACS1894184_02610 [Clostridia bacterium]